MFKNLKLFKTHNIQDFFLLCFHFCVTLFNTTNFFKYKTWGNEKMDIKKTNLDRFRLNRKQAGYIISS